MPELVPYPARTTLDLTVFAEEASQVHAISKALATTCFVPKPFQGRPDEVTAAILFGREIGLEPMVALQSVHVIEGRPSLTALAMRGIAQKAGVKFHLIESTATRCKMAARAPGDDQWTEVLWTTDRAKQLGLTTKQNWQKQPQAMLIARATSELCRLVAAHTFLGFEYSSEELGDGPLDERWANGTTTEPTAPAPKRTVRRQPVQATVDAPMPEPEPELPDRPEIGYSAADVAAREIEAPAPEGDMIHVNTRKALMATFNESGMKDRTARLEFVSEVLGREVHSVNQLNEAEGRTVLSAIKAATGSDWPQPAEVRQ